MTVRILDYRGDGTYYLADPALELDSLRAGPVGAVLVGDNGRAVHTALHELLDAPLSDGRRALDVIVAAPKPVSVLLAIEPPEVARRVVDLHERAARAVHGHLVGDPADPAPASTAVGFTHGVNRHLDPHLHTHVLVASRRADGTPIDARAMRWRSASADALYLAALREGLPGATGRAAWVGRSGATLVEGVDLGLVAATTTPRSRGGLLERAASKSHPSAGEVRRLWDAQVASCEELGLRPSPPARSASIDEYRFAALLGERLVGSNDVVRAWAGACTFGERPERVAAAVSLLGPELTPRARRPAVRVADAAGVKILGPRPRDLGELAIWGEGRAALARYLQGGHRLSHLEDPQGASAATRLAVARLDVELASRHLGRRDRGLARGDAVGRELS